MQKYSAFTIRGNTACRLAAIQPYASYLLLALVSCRRGVHEVVFGATAEIPTLILWLETIRSSSTRNQKVKWEGSSPDVTENAQPMESAVA